MSKTYCTLPWVQATASPKSDMILCCNTYDYSPIKKEDGSVVKITDLGEPLTFFNSATLKRIRKEMMMGLEPKECRKCYDIEKQGGMSIRNLSDTITPMDELFGATCDETGELKHNTFKHLHIIWGNKCNLMCKMCHPYSSNQLIKEFSAIQLIKKDQVEYYETFWKDDNNIEPLKGLAPYLTYLNVSGGEPLIINDFLEYCYYLIESGYSKNIGLSFHTNLTVMPSKFFDLWNHFKWVNIKVSLDATDKDYEYIRYPGKWSVVNKNVDRLIEMIGNHQNVECEFHSVFSSFNAHAVPRLIEYLSTKTTIFPYFNRVTDSVYSNCKVIPRQEKKIIFEKCIAAIDAFSGKFTHSMSVDRIENLKTHLTYMLDGDLRTADFFNFVRKQDSMRKLSYTEVIPWAHYE